MPDRRIVTPDAQRPNKRRKPNKRQRAVLAYDPWIVFPGGRKVPLSVIENSPQTRRAYLESYHGRKEDLPRCMCRYDGVELGVGRRSVPEESFYFYPLHRVDPVLHALRCPHHIDRQAHEEGDEENPEVVEVHGNRIVVRLKAPMRKRPPRASKEPEGESPSEEKDEELEEEEPLDTNESEKEEEEVTGDPYMEGCEGPPPRVRPPPQGDLGVLQNVLWSESELNIWHPGFEGVRSYNVVRNRLLQAADRIDVKGVHLRPLLYIPPKFSNSKKEECDQEWRRFLALMAADNKGARWFGFAMGVLKEIDTSREGVVTLQLKHMPRSLWIENKRWRRLAKHWFGTANEETLISDHELVLLTRVRRVEGKRGPWLQVEDLCGVEIENLTTWLPIHGTHENFVLARLHEESRGFMRPMMKKGGQPKPAFILLDRDDRMALEVIGHSYTGEESDKERVRRQRLYKTTEQPVWWWQVAKGTTVPDLPERQQDRRTNPDESAETSNEQSS